MRVTNRTRRTVLVDHGAAATTPWSRLKGLIGRRTFEAGDGLLLLGEQAIHTVGMLFAIDVVYLDGNGRVLHALPALAPLRLGPFVRGTKNVLELPMGTLAATRTSEGDELDIELTS